jgi:hypothetical protein
MLSPRLARPHPIPPIPRANECIAQSGADPSDLLVIRLIRRSFGRIALGLAQRNLFFLLSLLFLGPCARCPLSFGPVSAVIRLECHWNLSCGGLLS